MEWNSHCLYAPSTFDSTRCVGAHCCALSVAAQNDCSISTWIVRSSMQAARSVGIVCTSVTSALLLLAGVHGSGSITKLSVNRADGSRTAGKMSTVEAHGSRPVAKLSAAKEYGSLAVAEELSITGAHGWLSVAELSTN